MTTASVGASAGAPPASADDGRLGRRVLLISSIGHALMHMMTAYYAVIVLTLAVVGYVALAKPVTEIRIGQLVRETEENLTLVECFEPDHNTCPISAGCRLASYLDEALGAFLAVLDARSLADVLEPRSNLVTLLRYNERTPERAAS